MNFRFLLSHWRTGVLLLAIGAVLVPTMGPAPVSTSTPTFCIVCGEQGGADVIANLILFIPVGVALALQRWKLPTQVLFAAGLTFFIEAAQTTLIPGRDAAVGDLVFNTVGAIVGIGITKSFHLWSVPSVTLRNTLLLASGLAVGSIIIMTGILAQPSLSADQYRSQWTQRLSERGRYQGVIDSVLLGQRPLPEGYLDEANLIDDSVMAGSVLQIRGTAGPSPERFGPIYTIRAQANREIWTSGQYRDDLVFYHRQIAARFRLRQPRFLLNDVMGQVEPGDRLALDFKYQPPGFDVRVGDTAYHTAFRIRDGWRFVFPTLGVFPGFSSLASYVWIAGLALPMGLWLNASWGSIVAGGTISASVLATIGAKLLAAPGWTEIIGVAMGLLAGFCLRQLCVKFVPQSLSTPTVQTSTRTA